MAASATRQLTVDEKNTLHSLLPTESTFAFVWEIAGGSCLGVGCLTLIGMGVWLGVGTLLSLKPGVGYAFTATFLIGPIIVWGILVGVRLRVERRTQGGEINTIRADLNGGVARIERYQIKEAIRAIMVEHRERCYFLRLTDDRVIFAGFRNPPEDDNPSGMDDYPPETYDFPSTEIEIARGPASERILGVYGKGTPLQPTESFELKRASLNEGDEVKVPWSEIVKKYG